MLNKIPLKIHCWGGLGSQLYAWALFERLRKNFPKRRLRLVLHTSGVTRRASDLNDLFSVDELITLDDFGPLKKLENADQDNKKYKAKILTNGMVKLLLLFKGGFSSFGFIASCDNERSVALLKPWVFSIRGHYSKLVIDAEVLNAMIKRAKNYNFKHLEIDSTVSVRSALHYRLGDLLTLSIKSPIEAERVASCITKLDNRDLVIISDSTEIASQLLTKFARGVRFKTLDLPIWEAIQFLSSVQVFIGTPSKITEWVAIFRVHFAFDNRETMLPVEMKTQMNQVLFNEQKTKLISYY